MIEQFQNEYRWLSNFAPVKIILDGIEYPSVEHAYQSAKCNEEWWKDYCSNPLNSPGKIKRTSKSVNLVRDWDKMKLTVMEECLRRKFNQEPYKTKLLRTEHIFIQEGNYWGDTFWGVCLKTNRGENHLGKLIMGIRRIL